VAQQRKKDKEYVDVGLVFYLFPPYSVENGGYDFASHMKIRMRLWQIFTTFPTIRI